MGTTTTNKMTRSWILILLVLVTRTRTGTRMLYSYWQLARIYDHVPMAAGWGWELGICGMHPLLGKSWAFFVSFCGGRDWHAVCCGSELVGSSIRRT